MLEVMGKEEFKGLWKVRGLPRGLLIRRKEPQAVSLWTPESLALLRQDSSFDQATARCMCVRVWVCVCARARTHACIVLSDNVEVL